MEHHLYNRTAIDITITHIIVNNTMLFYICWGTCCEGWRTGVEAYCVCVEILYYGMMRLGHGFIAHDLTIMGHLVWFQFWRWEKKSWTGFRAGGCLNHGAKHRSKRYLGERIHLRPTFSGTDHALAVWLRGFCFAADFVWAVFTILRTSDVWKRGITRLQRW